MADSIGIQLGEKAADEDTYRTKDKTERSVLQAAQQIITHSFLRNSVTTKSTFFLLDLDQCKINFSIIILHDYMQGGQK